VGGAVGYNSFQVRDVRALVNINDDRIYALGGIIGQNANNGKLVRSGLLDGAQPLISNLNGGFYVGGLIGLNNNLKGTEFGAQVDNSILWDQENKTLLFSNTYGDHDHNFYTISQYYESIGLDLTVETTEDIYRFGLPKTEVDTNTGEETIVFQEDGVTPVENTITESRYAYEYSYTNEFKLRDYYYYVEYWDDPNLANYGTLKMLIEYGGNFVGSRMITALQVGNLTPQNRNINPIFSGTNLLYNNDALGLMMGTTRYVNPYSGVTRFGYDGERIFGVEEQ
jgi:hypothetical protein